MDDVDRISWGRPAKKKGTGSRGVPHRLNNDERLLYDLARQKGFVEIGGSGWRRQRSDSPLVNTFRSWCAARAAPAIYVHKGAAGDDEVVVDLSPLRTPHAFDQAAAFCLLEASASDGFVEGLEWAGDAAVAPVGSDGGDSEEQEEGGGGDESTGLLAPLEEAFFSQPIYRLPAYAVVWQRPRSESKVLAKALSGRLKTAEKPKGRRKARGAPKIKPGASRRSGGYGIG